MPTGSTKGRIPIPLFEHKVSSTETVKVKFRTNPEDAANPGQNKITFMRVNAFDSGEEYIHWRLMLDEVARQMPLNTPGQLGRWAGILLTFNAGITWHSMIEEHDMETAEGVKAAFDAVAIVAMGTNGWIKQYTYMRELKKPKDMRVVHFAQRLHTMSTNIDFCTGPRLSLTSEDMKQILINACPDSYMFRLKASYRPAEKTYHQLVEDSDRAEAQTYHELVEDLDRAEAQTYHQLVEDLDHAEAQIGSSPPPQQRNTQQEPSGGEQHSSGGKRKRQMAP